MRILEIVEATDKTAVFAFGRMNPNYHWTPKKLLTQ